MTALASEVLSALLVVSVACVPCSAAIREGPTETIFQIESDPILIEAFHQRHGKDAVDDDGATGANLAFDAGTSKKWFIEEQRWGMELLPAGVVLNDQELIDRGLKCADWGIKRESTGGAFPGAPDAFHSVSFFVDVGARGLLMMKQSGRAAYAPTIAKYATHYSAAAQWLLTPDPKQYAMEQPFTHRKYLVADALAFASELDGDPALASAAEKYVREGVALQTPEGFNPERGGPDMGYHPFSLLLAARYRTLCHDADLCGQLDAMLSKGVAWMLTHIDAQGNVDATNSTRIGKELDRSGKVKGVNYRCIISSLVYAAHLSHDAVLRDRYLSIARAVASRQGLLGSPPATAVDDHR